MDLEGPWQKFQLSDVTDGVGERICEQLLVSKECEQLIETQLRLIVHRQIVRQAGKYGFMDKHGVFSYARRLQNPEKGWIFGRLR